jgi:hypothetical protein
MQNQSIQSGYCTLVFDEHLSEEKLNSRIESIKSLKYRVDYISHIYCDVDIDYENDRITFKAFDYFEDHLKDCTILVFHETDYSKSSVLFLDVLNFQESAELVTCEFTVRRILQR